MFLWLYFIEFFVNRIFFYVIIFDIYLYCSRYKFVFFFVINRFYCFNMMIVVIYLVEGRRLDLVYLKVIINVYVDFF